MPSHLALYRKYRPRTFSDVVGQEHITDILKAELIKNTPSHAYVFTGSRGTGKTTCAKILAKAVNCLNLKDGEPCCECENCRAAENGSLIDIVEIDAASNNGVDNIRDIRDEVVFTPAQGKMRVYIIDEVHMLSAGAFNALLKTLEEPPEYIVFILATTEAHKIPQTILSRCQRFDFRRITREDTLRRVLETAQKEGIGIVPEAAEIIAKSADGALRDALALLEKCAADEGEITANRVKDAIGLADRGHISTMLRAAGTGDFSACVRLVADLYQDSKDLMRLCEELILYLRDMLIWKGTNDKNLTNLDEEQFAELEGAAADYSPEKILYAVGQLSACYDKMARSVSKRVDLELCLYRICNLKGEDDINAVLERLDALEEKLAAVDVCCTQGAGEQKYYVGSEEPGGRESLKMAKGPADPARKNTGEEKTKKPASEQQKSRPAGAADPTGPTGPTGATGPAVPEEAEVPFDWNGLLSNLKKRIPPHQYSFLSKCGGALEGGVLKVTAPDELSRDMLSNPEVKAALSGAAGARKVDIAAEKGKNQDDDLFSKVLSRIDEFHGGK